MPSCARDDDPLYLAMRATVNALQTSSLFNPSELRELCFLRLGGNEQGSEDEDGGRQELDHHVKRRPRRVLEGVPDGVAGDSRLVRVAALSSEVPQLSEPDRGRGGGVASKQNGWG